MNPADIDATAAWLAQSGLAGHSGLDILTGFCKRAVACGLPIARAIVIIDTLDPVHEGQAFRWRAQGAAPDVVAYGSSAEGEAAENWRRSPFFRLLESGQTLFRRRLDDAAAAEFPSLATARAEGLTDYVALAHRFAAEGVIGEMDSVLSSWHTDRPGGFLDGEVAALARLSPFLALAMKCAALSRITLTLAETYLGRDAARLVLGGRIGRGQADRIDAVIWFSDLRGYTRITDTSAPEEIIPLLNDYAAAIIAAVEAEGGDVLKLIGDGVLAIFRAPDRRAACVGALAAAAAAAGAVAALNERRAAEHRPTTDFYLGLHVGEVFYGNIGSQRRLDFTVVGPAVNEAARIAAMCRSADRPLLLSSAFAAALADPARLASVGRYALRGFGRPQELFTLDPDA
ncbi:MAG: adenylate/guanylate cyclase domain-containing protein [Dongiaceae bacterium]